MAIATVLQRRNCAQLLRREAVRLEPILAARPEGTKTCEPGKDGCVVMVLEGLESSLLRDRREIGMALLTANFILTYGCRWGWLIDILMVLGTRPQRLLICVSRGGLGAAL